MSGLEPQYLELERTESVLMLAILAVINELKATGASFAIDYFATGYSSLSYLMQFAVNKSNIDQSFIKYLSSNKSEDSAIVQVKVQLGETLGLQTLAEDAETREQAEQLAHLGCEMAPGGYWHQPLPSKDFVALFKRD